MPGKDDLFQLIRSLSKTEKRYFKVQHAKTGTDPSNYLRLFDVINKMENYDEAALRNAFQGERLLKNLPKEKAYLYQAILKSMRAYRKDKSSDVRIRELLANASFLRERSLYSQCQHMLQKAKKIALEYENNIALVEILYQERELLKNLKPRKGENKMNELIDETNYVLSELTKQSRYLELYDSLFFQTLQSTQARDQESTKKLKQIITDDLISDEAAATGFSNKHRQLSIKAMNAILNSESEKAYEYYGKIVELWNQNDKIRNENIYRYRNVLSNFLNSCFIAEKFDPIPNTIALLKTIPPKNFHDEGTIFKNVYLSELNYCISMVELEKGEALIPEIEAGLKTHKETIGDSRIQTFNGNIAILFFLKEDFEQALDWVNRIINSPKSKTRQDIQRFARLFQLIPHFELENVGLMENLLRSVSRHLNAMEEVLQFEKLVIKSFRRLLNSPKSDHKEIMTQIHSDIQSLLSEERERTALGFTVFEVWIKARITGRSIADTFRSNKSV